MRIFIKSIIPVLLGALCIKGYSQMRLDTMYFDRHWKQCGKDTACYYREVFADMGKKVRFIVKDHYKSGSLQMEGAYRAINPDIKDGHFIYYYENGNKMTEVTYMDNEPEGDYREWYANGIPKLLSQIHRGALHGQYKTWTDKGLPQIEIEYKAGVLDGRFISYYDNGRPVRKDTYSRGEIKKKRCFTREGKDTIWFPYLQMPEFPGGPEKLDEYIDKELVYPKEAKDANKEARIMVEFAIDREGKIGKIHILKGDREYFNNEALRLVSTFPKWLPGRKDGELIEVTLSLPIRFKIKQDE